MNNFTEDLCNSFETITKFSVSLTEGKIIMENFELILKKTKNFY